MILLEIAKELTENGMRITEVCEPARAVKILELLPARFRFPGLPDALHLFEPVPPGDIRHVCGYMADGRREWSSELRAVRPRGTA